MNAGADTCSVLPAVGSGTLDAGDIDAGDVDAGDVDAGDVDAGDVDVDAGDVDVDAGDVDVDAGDDGDAGHDGDAGDADDGGSGGIRDAGEDSDAGALDAGGNIDAGDDDAGALDAGALDGGAPDPCTDVLTGNFTVEHSLELSQLKAFCEVTGDLLIEFPDVPDLGGLRGLRLSFPSLVTSSSSFKIRRTDQLMTLNLPLFEKTRSLVVSSAVELSVGPPLSSLTTIDLPQFSDCSSEDNPPDNFPGIAFIDNPSLTTLSLPSLSDCDRIAVHNSGLHGFTAAGVSSLPLGFSFAGNAALQTVSLPDLTVGPTDRNVNFDSNAVLTDIDLPALDPPTNPSAVQTVIVSNPNLPQCVIDDVLARLGTGCICGGNGPPGTCD